MTTPTALTREALIRCTPVDKLQLALDAALGQRDHDTAASLAAELRRRGAELSVPLAESSYYVLAAER